VATVLQQGTKESHNWLEGVEMSSATPAGVDIEGLVREAIDRAGLPVHESAERAIVDTGRQGEDELIRELESGVSEEQVVNGLVDLLRVARQVAGEQGEPEIRDTTMVEAMKRHCPIKPWC
jgi:hypothetical protein